MRYQRYRKTLVPSNRRCHQGMIAILGSLVVLSVFMLLLGATTAETQTGKDERCNGLTRQARGLCTAAVSEGCFDGEESDECDELTTNWMEHCSRCAEVGVYPWAVCGSAYARCVFVTSQTYTGNLDGLSGADSKCQELADAAGLSGSFKAWLSDSTTEAHDRLAQAAVPYVRVDGVHVAKNWTDLTDGSLLAPIDKDETGDLVFAENVWTGTRSDGTTSHLNGTETQCNDWTSSDFAGCTRAEGICANIGNSFRTNVDWTDRGACACCGPRDIGSQANILHLYCFEQ